MECFSGMFEHASRLPDFVLISYRCQTCPQAFCEDCLPEDDIDAIGDTLPELFVVSSPLFQSVSLLALFLYSLLLGFYASPTVYFIRCHDCQSEFAKDPSTWKTWQQEFEETEQKLRVMLNFGSS